MSSSATATIRSAEVEEVVRQKANWKIFRPVHRFPNTDASARYKTRRAISILSDGGNTSRTHSGTAVAKPRLWNGLRMRGDKDHQAGTTSIISGDARRV